MALEILIVSDDDVALRQTAVALGPLGSTAAERSPEVALERLLEGGAGIAVIDGGLDGGRGADLARTLRRRGSQLPLVLLTTDEEAMPADPRLRVLAKPIDPDGLRAVVRQLGAPSGSLAQRPVPVLLADFARGRARGRLDLESPGFSASVHLDDGFVRGAIASDRGLLAGWAEVKAGKLSQALLDEALARTGGDDAALPDALLATGAMDEPRIAAALSQQTARVVERACAMPQGTWRFVHDAPAPGWARAHLHPLALVDAGVRAAYPAETIRAWLGRYGEAPVQVDEALQTVLARAGIASPIGQRIAGSRADGLGTTLGPADLALLFTLAAFRLVRFGAAGHGAPSSAVAPIHRRGGIDAVERAVILSEQRRLEGANHYEVLGVAPDAGSDDIRKAYFGLARKWHSDAFAGRDLGDVAPVVGSIFARIAEAQRVLMNPEQRAEYDVFLDRKAKGLPTDVSSVFEAEEAFHKAQAHIRGQRWSEAEKLLRRAVELNSAEAEFQAWLGAAIHRTHGSAGVAEARAAFARARDLIPELLVTDFLEAQLEIGEGEFEAAEARLQKILLEQPDHGGAQQALRNLRERKEKMSATGRGFFGTLWKRK